ncbi:hypothetical protein B6N60_00275 [Richelia sinica FACHB-800]|uniref:Uncharacterized protein n=1 Tax=Richelia sinica FACHB-800 TaxID=1357546 RepID=A0A975Y2Z1_9NOST|nr:hypothetical protein B6N60_00275 [Richelia sinica FACHB-800]
MQYISENDKSLKNSHYYCCYVPGKDEFCCYNLLTTEAMKPQELN